MEKRREEKGRKLQLRISNWGAGGMFIEKYVRDDTVHYSSKLQPLKYRVILYYFLFWFILFHRNNLFPIKFYHYPIPLFRNILLLSFLLIYFYSFRSFFYSDLFSSPCFKWTVLFPSLLFCSLLFSTVLVSLLLLLSLLSSILLLINFLTLSSHL